MKVKKIYDSCYDFITKAHKKVFDVTSDNSSMIIKNFENNTLDQIADLLQKKEQKEFKKQLEDNLISDLKNLIENQNKTSKDVITDLTSKTNDIILFSMNNYFIPIKTLEKVVKEYKDQIKEINLINKTFIKNLNVIFELYLYKVSIDYKLKESIPIYNLITKVIAQNKKILLDNLLTLNNLLKEDVINVFEENIVSFIEEINELRENANTTNRLILVDYSKEMLKNKASLKVNKTLKNNCNQIGKILTSCHEGFLSLTKSKNSKSKQIILQDLNNYFISFNNALFAKSANLILEMTNIVDYNKNEFEKNINKYNEFIYKICDFEYTFERQFLKYKKELLKNKIVTATKLEIIDKLLHETEAKIVEVIKASVIELFKDSVKDLNTVSYKTVMVEYKLKNYYDVLDSKIIDKLFA